MQVVVRNNNNYAGGVWNNALGQAIGQGLSGLLSGMFERAKSDRFMRHWGKFQNDIGPEREAVEMEVASPEANRIAAENPPTLSQANINDTWKPSAPNLNVKPISSEFVPNADDGLVSTARKAVLSAANPRTRDDYYGKMGRYFSLPEIEMAMKLGALQTGNKFNIEDADRLNARIGEMPKYNDRQGTLEYMNRMGIYNPSQAQTLSKFIQELNPNLAQINQKNRISLVDPKTGMPVNAFKVGIDPNRIYDQNQANYRARLAASARSGSGSGDRDPKTWDVAKAAAPYIRLMSNTTSYGDGMPQSQVDGMFKSIMSDYVSDPQRGLAIWEYLTGRETIPGNDIANGEMGDVVKPNLLYGRQRTTPYGEAATMSEMFAPNAPAQQEWGAPKQIRQAGGEAGNAPAPAATNEAAEFNFSAPSAKEAYQTAARNGAFAPQYYDPQTEAGRLAVTEELKRQGFSDEQIADLFKRRVRPAK